MPTDSATNTRDDDFQGGLVIRLPPGVLKDLAAIDGVRACRAIALEWIAIFAAMIVCDRVWHPLLYVLTVMFIGGRQHALAVLQHDAAHYRLLPHKRWNDIVAEAVLAWPILLSTQWFRRYHFLHHRHLGTPNDGNRIQYHTHTPTGKVTPAWTFPKRKLRFVIWVLPRLSGLAGCVYVLRAYNRLLTHGSWRYRLSAIAYFSSIGTLILWGQLGQWFLLYWLVPLCTWFVFSNLLRISGEHSAIDNANPFYGLTRTTIPSWFDQIFLVPRNISYHVEHHLFPQVPFYRLPELHAQLMMRADYKESIHITKTVGNVIRELVT